jgi:hypothetical protein
VQEVSNCQTITMEEIPPAHAPEWLTSHYLLQMQDPRPLNSGGPAQLLTIHPTESARRATLNHLAKGGKQDGPIDRTSHHTLDSLVSSLHAELRLLRLLPSDGPFSILLHAECKKAARALKFPLMHSLPDQHWGRGKSRDLTNLNHSLSEELVTSKASPDLLSFRTLLTKLSGQLGGIHRDDQLSSLVSILETLPVSDVPFGLSRIDGIIFLDHPPTVSPLRERLILALTRFKPLHVLANSGSHRLGLHGFVPNDISAIRDSANLPDWVPNHTLFTHVELTNIEQEKYRPIRMLVPRIERSIQATHALIDSAINAKSPPESILIIDPSAESNHEVWSSMLNSLGFHLPIRSAPLKESPGVHWLSAITSLAHYEDAWSLPQLRALAVQQTLQFEVEWVTSHQHPTIADLTPYPDVEILEQVSRGFHLLGGQGALFRWLHALARKPLANSYQNEEELRRRHESTQWWLLCLANRLRPLLSSIDVNALDNSLVSIGCYSGEKLPIPKPSQSGDEWLSQFGSMLHWHLLTSNLDGDVNRTITGLQQLFETHYTLRKSQRLLGHSPPQRGLDWVDELLTLIDSSSLSGKQVASSKLKLLTPDEALGCHAELVILTHLDSESWNTSPPSIPGLSESERSELGVLAPDNRLREARHFWYHLLNCGSEVIVLDAHDDDSSQPSTPLSEWLVGTKWDPSSPPSLPEFISSAEVFRIDGGKDCRWGLSFIEGEGPFLCARPSDIISSGDGGFELVVTGSHQRDYRQRDGIEIHNARYPMQVPLDAILIEDRISRQPRIGSEEQPYLNSDRNGEIVTVDELKMTPTSRGPKVEPPRLHPSWPTIGLKVGSSKAMTIDPRPLMPNSTGINDHDLRHGFTGGPSRKTKVWSPSRLSQWLSCPRKGWLSTRLRAEGEDDEDDDVDVRTRGLLIHEVWADFICEFLGMEVEIERDNLTPHSLGAAGIEEATLRRRILEMVDEKAPWLRHSDAIATVRRLDLVGLNLEPYEAALDEGGDATASGRFGRLLESELAANASALLAIEWPLTSGEKKEGIMLELPESGEGVPSGIRLRGTIDRVEIIPFPELDGRFVNESGEDSECPLDLNLGESWNAQRLVVIRDLKSLEGPGKGKSGDRHLRELLEGVQLALYARAWEVTHPGDRVIGVGISEVGEESGFYIEADPEFKTHISSLGIGTVECSTQTLYRRPNEISEPPTSNPFRAWIRHRLTAALRIGEMSENGRVIPTPSDLTCTYCSVKEVCGLAPTVGGDRKWN